MKKVKLNFFSPYYRNLSDDWTSWYTISEESRKSDYKKTRNYWKNRFFEEEISALHLAVENEDIDIVKLLLNDANIDVNKVLIRFYDTESRHQELDTKREEKNALHLAIEKRNLTIVKLLCRNPKIRINDGI